LNRYYPGQCVRMSTSVDVLGVPATPSGGATLLLQPPGGTELTFSSPAVDGLGIYHQDYVIPLTGPTGQWLYRWVTTGAPVQAGVDDSGRFVVVPLRF
jgi:hypothetical protein